MGETQKCDESCLPLSVREAFRTCDLAAMARIWHASDAYIESLQNEAASLRSKVAELEALLALKEVGHGVAAIATLGDELRDIRSWCRKAMGALEIAFEVSPERPALFSRHGPLNHNNYCRECEFERVAGAVLSEGREMKIDG